ncbi:hydroxymethylglutaryl-CoA reductase, degradative [Litorilinea aerophila]|uniref:3-hydroxy-3-methylglutaryl coenzyme A reductase n=1 Tax=Litorilinea aerophila TaxID=1204385 RepID=A0A540VM10_9CHLR|nr:hydroxymethylglutaryl-CoA reductase, degradative [Litorilinea aerophila]MCC9075258.1 hydroxymethylglutaryl-CoA reductase, degradative [Litorilinea aerophila]OUC06832.1 3-hydroxy-3-methylglutaryl-CoA reductase [Litorilinea aerophila]GIV78398.1 MAG: 3-hydroxy-3-methylglutaryl coenzyme A reductase [Litorilinea sp.]
MTETQPTPRSSRLSGFYQLPMDERLALVARWAGLTPEEVAWLQDGLSLAQADKMVENVVGRYALPLAIGANFTINGRDILIPMVIEEPSVVAAVSYAARLARLGGGFRTGSTEPVMIGQIQLLEVPDMERAMAAIQADREELLALANTSATIARQGGGPVDIQARPLPETPAGPMLIVHLLFDTRDAMGANAINTAVETLAPRLERITGGRALLRILSNLSDQRRAWAEVAIPASAFSSMDFNGLEVIQGIAQANAFAVADPYRAATHNKGILNGIDAVVLATGNDWRAVEAGAHAYAARDGRYRALTEWRVVEDLAGELPELHAWRAAGQAAAGVNHPLDEPHLYGRLEMPLAVGIVGGATRAHPTARVALKILGVTSARELAEVMAAVGLAQNLAALRALATEGIQRGHMALHARQIAVSAGAQGAQVDRIAARLVQEGQIRLERARELLQGEDQENV